jgi:tetratricopeptide (TPR) repeat protein
MAWTALLLLGVCGQLNADDPRNHLVSRQAERSRPDDLQRALRTSMKMKRMVAIKTLDLRGLTANDAEGLFWKGYRQYWQSEHEDALTYFEAATELFDEDARFWYYRALAETVLGMTREADISLRHAADLHLRGRPSMEAISQALERVQGEARMYLREALDARRSAR